jgi:dodecin
MGCALDSSAHFSGIDVQGSMSRSLRMKDHVYKLIELTGTSDTSMEAAINNAIRRASTTVKNLRWFQVIETRGDIQADRVAHWQVTLKVGFTVEE